MHGQSRALSHISNSDICILFTLTSFKNYLQLDIEPRDRYTFIWYINFESDVRSLRSVVLHTMYQYVEINSSECDSECSNQCLLYGDYRSNVGVGGYIEVSCARYCYAKVWSFFPSVLLKSSRSRKDYDMKRWTFPVLEISTLRSETRNLLIHLQRTRGCEWKKGH